MTQPLEEQITEEQSINLNTEFDQWESPITPSEDKKRFVFKQKEIPTKELQTTKTNQKEEIIEEKPVSLFSIPNVDTQRVQQAWLDMINDVRSEAAGDYTINPDLNTTSIERANYLGTNRIFKQMHKRPGQTCKNYRCYDLWEWMTDRGVSASTQESIGYGGYSCNKDDCTDALIEATKKTFRFFMSEAKKNGPHYKMIVSWDYSTVGIGISQTKASRWNAYVLVMHVSN